MHFARDDSAGDFLIKRYTPGSMIIGATEYDSSLILTPSRLITDWAPENFQALQAGHFTRLLELEPEVVILGTGAHLQFPHPAITSPLLTQGVGVEVMDTAAACRTYNVLLSEGRQVVAALLL